MTITVGVFEAKTKLSELLEQVSRGEQVIITRRGVPVAQLVPPPTREAVYRDLLALGREIRSRTAPGDQTAKELIEQGRRW